MHLSADLVSVIIPTKKRNQFLNRAIQSVVLQNYAPLEICIVDNNHQPELSKEIKEMIFLYRSNYPQITWIYHQSDKLYSGGVKNDGVDLVSGQFICFLDDDDELLPNSIKARMNVMLADKQVALVYCAGYSKIYPYPFKMYRYYHHYEDKVYDAVKMMSCSSMIINKALFKENGIQFDESLSRLEDFDLGKTLMKKGMKIKSIPEALVLLHLHPYERMSTYNPSNLEFGEILIKKWGDYAKDYTYDYVIGHYLWRRCFEIDKRSYNEVKNEIVNIFSKTPSYKFKIKYQLVSLSPIIYLALYHTVLSVVQVFSNKRRL